MTKYFRFNHEHCSPQIKAEVGEETKSYIKENSRKVRELLAKSRLHGLNGDDTVSFADSAKEYNKDITDNDIKAWVAFKRTTGVPMTGWENWFVDGIEEKCLAVTTEDSPFFDCTNGEKRRIGRLRKGCIIGLQIDDNKFLTQDGRIVCLDENIERIRGGVCYEIIRGYKPRSKEMDKLVKAGSMFRFNGTFLPKAYFAAGDIYAKIKIVERDKDHIINGFGVEVYENHLRVLREVTPKLLRFEDKNPDYRPIVTPWEAESMYINKSYLKSDYVDIESWANDYCRYRDEVELNYAFRAYLTRIPAQDIRYSLNASYIIEYGLDNSRMNSGDVERNKRIKGKCVKEAKRLFTKFLADCITEEGKIAMTLSWNEKHNNIAPIDYKNVPIGFSHSNVFGKSEFSLRPIQQDGVRFISGNGNGCVSFDVGVGKTITAISAVAEALQEGRCKRPIIIVPKSTYPNWQRELVGNGSAKGVLSGCGIKLNLIGNGTGFDPSEIKDGTISLATAEFLSKIKYTKSYCDDVNNFDNFLYNAATIVLQGRDKNDAASTAHGICLIAGGVTEVDVEADKNKKKSERRKKIIPVKNTHLFDEYGFDFAVLDEAHRYKALLSGIPAEKKNRFKQVFHTARGNVSQDAIRAFLFSRHIQGGGGNVVLLTATPFSNRPLEILSMLTLVSYDKIAVNGFDNARSFFSDFVNENFEPVVDAKLTIKWDYSIDSFNNKKTLQNLISQFIIYRTGDEAGILRPAKIDIPYNRNKFGTVPQKQQVLSYLSMFDWQATKQDYLNFLINQSGTHGSEGEDALFSALSLSLENAFSPFAFKIKDDVKFFLYLNGCGYEYTSAKDEFKKFNREPTDYNDFVENSPKIKYTCECVKGVKVHDEERGNDVSGQIIFARLGIPYFPLIKQYLEDSCGFKKSVATQVYNGEEYETKMVDEVEIIASGISAEKKDIVMNAFNDGIVKVIIGSPTIQEGVNLQKRSTVLYCLTPFWNPTDMQQLEGRIYRQGNRYQYVRIVQPLVQNSMDVFVYQKLQEKMGRVNDLWNTLDRGNIFNFENLDPLEVKLALITDIAQLADIEIGMEKDNLNAEYTNLVDLRNRLSDLSSLTSSIEGYRTTISTNINQSVKKIVSNAKVESDPDNKDSWNNHEIYFLRQRITKEEMKKLPKASQEFVKKHTDKFNDFQEEWGKGANTMTVKELASFYKKILTWGANAASCETYEIEGNVPYYEDDVRKTISQFEIKKNQISKLTGWKVGESLNKFEDEINKQIEDVRERRDEVESDEHRQDVMDEIETKKRKQGVIGKTVLERVKDFEKLNYLLNIPFTGFRENNVLPDPSDAVTSKSKKETKGELTDEERLAFAKAKFKMARARRAREERLSGWF